MTAGAGSNTKEMKTKRKDNSLNIRVVRDEKRGEGGMFAVRDANREPGDAKVLTASYRP